MKELQNYILCVIIILFEILLIKYFSEIVQVDFCYKNILFCEMYLFKEQLFLVLEIFYFKYFIVESYISFNNCMNFLY